MQTIQDSHARRDGETASSLKLNRGVIPRLCIRLRAYLALYLM